MSEARPITCMRAVLYSGQRGQVTMAELSLPQPAAHQILIRVQACGVCRTDLHVIDAELPHPKLPIIPGHEIVGTVIGCGSHVKRFQTGCRVGVPWLGWTCGECRYCLGGRENLCPEARFTGYQIDGGYAELALADERYCFAIPHGYSAQEAAPLLCAGLIGYRALKAAGEADRIGIYGFGAAAHIVAQVARHQQREIYAFTRAGDTSAQDFALKLGACWAGDSTHLPPEELDTALIFAPVGALVPLALKAVRKGGSVVCAGIHMSDIPSFRYELLWGERVIRSVANLTRQDGEEFLALAPQVPVHCEVTAFGLEQAAHTLAQLRAGKLTGAAVIVP